MSGSKHEIMTAAEVAEYLRVAERTVYDWAQKGILPGAKIGAAWRFRQPEIVSWFNRKFAASGSAASAVHLTDVLARERVLFTDATSKRAVLQELIECLQQAPEIRDAKQFADGIFRREELMSTGIGLGIGLPHVRLDSITDPVMAVAKCEAPVADYDSLDGEPVRVVFMIAAGKDQHAQHILLLSAISQRMKNTEFHDLLLATESPDAFYEVLIREPA